MKLTTRRVKFAWKYRRPLWKYRKLLRYRKPIAGAVLGALAIGAGVLIKKTVSN